VGATPWRFKSSHPHSVFLAFRCPFSAQTFVAVVVALTATGCSGGSSTEGPETQVDSATTATTTTEATTTAAVEPALTHREFINRLDRLCLKGNRQLERRYGAAFEAAYAANDYDRLADLFQRSRRLNRPFYTAVRELRRDVPDRDARGLRQYLSLSHQMDIYYARSIRAYRERDDAELARLSSLIERARSQRTRVTAKMGLRECGS
jgi:hypothetical protein